MKSQNIPILAMFTCKTFTAAATSIAPALCTAPAPLTFQAGSTEGQAEGGIASGELACWTVSAKAGQAMAAKVMSSGRNAVMDVYQPGWKVFQKDGDTRFSGMALKGVAEGEDATSWMGKLPTSGRYLFVLGSSSGGADYQLSVTIVK